MVQKDAIVPSLGHATTSIDSDVSSRIRIRNSQLDIATTCKELPPPLSDKPFPPLSAPHSSCLGTNNYKLQPETSSLASRYVFMVFHVCFSRRDRVQDCTITTGCLEHVALTRACEVALRLPVRSKGQTREVINTMAWRCPLWTVRTMEMLDPQRQRPISSKSYVHSSSMVRCLVPVE